MKVALMSHIRGILAAVMIAIATFVIWWGFVTVNDIPTAGASTIEPLSAAPSVRAPDLGSSSISERPLFLQRRRPLPETPPAEPTQVQQAPTPTLSLVLVGIVLSPGVRAAVVRLPNGKNVTVAEGQLVDGWKLVRVMPDLANFRFSSTTVELSFPVHRASAVGFTSATAPAVVLRRRQ